MSVNPSLTDGVRAGIGFRAAHFEPIRAARPAAGFLEIHAENYMGGGAAVAQLEELRADWPISVHAVGLSLGSACGINARHLQRLAELIDRIEPLLLSEHLSWSTSDGVYLNDLVPLPLTEESLAVVTTNILSAQDRLRRPLLIENPSAYLRFAHSTIPEAEFLTALVGRTGCRLLCDVNNLFVSTQNLGGDPDAWLAATPAAAVGEIHLAGHSVNDADGWPLLIDDHGSRVAEPVWTLFERAIVLFPHAASLIEWDTDLPELTVLLDEAAQADRRRAAALGKTIGEQGRAAAA